MIGAAMLGRICRAMICQSRQPVARATLHVLVLAHGEHGAADALCGAGSIEDDPDPPTAGGACVLGVRGGQGPAHLRRSPGVTSRRSSLMRYARGARWR